MRWKQMTACLFGSVFLILSAEEKTADMDWCSIRYPDKVEPEKTFSVVLTPKDVPDGMKIGGDLHHASPGQYIGYAAWGGPLKKAEKNVPLTFKYRMPKFRSEDRGAQIIFFLTEKGWNESKKKAYSPVILPQVKSGTVSAEAPAKTGQPEKGSKIAENSWCTIHYPEKAIPGKNFTVTVTLKDIPSGMKVGGDLHHAEKDKYIGYAAWGGSPKNAKPGQTLSFTYKMPAFQKPERGAQPIFFLTEKGWNESRKKAYCPVILPLVNAEVRKTVRPQTATLKKSWIRFGKVHAGNGKAPVWKSGETLFVPVEYFVDPSDNWGKTRLCLWIVGPWIDNPDGVYTTRRHHAEYHCWAPDIQCVIGKTQKSEWSFKIPNAYAERAPEKGKYGDDLLLIAYFRGADSQMWPWQVRHGLPSFTGNSGYFDLDAPTPGNLFTYDQDVVMNIIPGPRSKGMERTKTNWNVTDTSGKTVASGTVVFPAPKGGAVRIPIRLTEKGTFLLRVEIPGKEAGEVTFARIPDIAKIIGNRPTKFGGQKFSGHNPEAVRAARMLGMSSCRLWLSWGVLEPERGKFNETAFRDLRKSVDVLNANNIHPWFLLNGVPKWAIQNPKTYGAEFCALPVKDEDVERIVTKLAKEFKNNIIGFEWLNEIVPGSVCKDPVAEYLSFCKAGSTASKKVNPKFRNQLAGGLWPQTFRQSLIAAGIANYIDILPIHYGDAGAVRGARQDLAAVGAEKKVAVWDNETARGLSTWGMPLSIAMKEKIQSDYFFTCIPDELLAGCEHINLFAGEASPAGNWSHFWGDMSPRPGAAALAVLVHALADAKPLGEFSLGKGDSIKVFERPNRPLLMVVSTLEKDGETISIPAGKTPMVRISQQGNTSPVKQESLRRISLTKSPCLLEGGNPEIIKAQLVMSFPGASAGIPAYSVLSGNTAEIPLRFTNILKRPLNFTVTLDSATAPGTSAPIAVRGLHPGQETRDILKFKPEKEGMFHTFLAIRFDDPELPAIRKRIAVNALNPAKLGNLLKNPGFEKIGSDGAETARDWDGSGNAGERTAFNNPLEPGHGGFVYRFQNTNKQYQSIWQNIRNLPVQGEYVYSMWIKAERLQTGSNLGGCTVDGKSWNWHWLKVFQAPVNQPYWQVFRKRFSLPNGTDKLTAAPVANGSGWSMIDNLQLVPYEGTEFAAFAPKTGKKIRIDGNLNDFNRSAPIPLIGKNQLRLLNKNYNWKPENLSGVAYFNWDENYLYAAFEVVDDKHTANKTEAQCASDDSIRLALHPMNRMSGEDSRAYCFDISAARPGGSGKHTIYRPAQFSGGLKSGSLAKDSSVYNIAIVRKNGVTVYEIAMPWNDLGVAGRLGGKLGLSLLLRDNDGNGPEAVMLWGDGLYPVWNPTAFGILTLINPK